MLVAKRGRPGPPMKRNTSMTEFTLDLVSGGCGGEERVYSTTAAVVPINHRKSADFAETAHFLRICSLCNHCLVPGHDIYMYRGDAAFCSVECRQRQMTHDERREKRSLRSKKGVPTAAAAVPRMSAAV